MTAAELLGFPDTAGVKAALIALLQRPGFPVTDYESGGGLRTLVELEAAVISDLLDAITAQVAGTLLESSDGEWLDVLSHGWYGLDRAEAQIAKQQVTLTRVAGTGTAYAISALNAFVASDGTRYLASTFGTLAAGGTLTIDATAESPGAARGLIARLDPPLPGVTVTGAIIKVDSGVPQYGADGEGDAALIARCQARWPSAAVDDSTPDRLEKWARAGSPEVTRVRLDPIGFPGGVLVTIGGAAGVVSSGAVLDVRAYIAERAPITDYILTSTASAPVVLPGGTVTVRAGLQATVSAAADAAWVAYLGLTQIGGVVYLSQLLKAVMDAGAVDFTGVALDGVADDVSLASGDVATPNPAGLGALLTWVSV